MSTSLQYATSKLLPSQSGKLGIVSLNNPKAFHALTSDMMFAAQEVLQEWYDNPNITAILWESNQPQQNSTTTDSKSQEGGGRRRPRAFCAGGDIKTLSLTCKEGNHAAASEFFRQEYYLNYGLSLQRKPQISIWDGLVMGGGVGISIYGSYRIATEHTVFAMPENAIGLFPDIGSMWAFPRCMKQPFSSWVIPYILLTGHKLLPSDLLYTGLATHYIPSQDIPQLKAALIQATTSSSPNTSTTDLLTPILDSFHRPISVEDCFLAQHAQEMEQVFAPESSPTSQEHVSFQHVLDRVEALPHSSTIRSSALNTMNRVSPTSLIVTWELWNRRMCRQQQSSSSLADDLALEFQLAQRCIQPRGDFHEGVRATLLDKTKPPQWNPATLQQALTQEQEIIEAFFGDQSKSGASSTSSWNIQDSTILKLT